ncbi:glutamine synthetase family protein [Sphingomonas sp. TX0543]|uniref:glutamine synthetase family protein n=1 Tax=unclassified Sphingomonas TaxID=196159 RepID=UPI0010F820CF|nr:glutamine synthetase family protein [Sphingomonas sp. 3P27F8]
MSHQDHQLLALLEAHPEITRVEAFVSDVNGVARGKWLTREKALTLDLKGLAMPRSVFALDIWGRDVPDAGLAFGTGDPDGLFFPVANRAALLPWFDGATAQVMLGLSPEGDPGVGDARGVLAQVQAALAARGLHPVVATELEFYLHQLDEAGRPVPPGASAADDLRHVNAILSPEAKFAHLPLFDEIMAICAAMGIPADTLSSEAGPGQFELNLLHRTDAITACDDAILLKRIIKALARRHGLGATFMAKPYGDASGNGMHIHVSLLDSEGHNVLAEADGAPSETLFHAVAGLLKAMPDSMLAFAPHANSYRRFRANAHAPVAASWGVDDRSAAIRVVKADARATRIEHRVPGADCNPYLAVAAVLAGMLAGIAAGEPPPAPQQPGAPEVAARLPAEWGVAIDRFAASDFIARAFGRRFRDILVACKRQDRDTLLARVSDAEYASYLGPL